MSNCCSLCNAEFVVQNNRVLKRNVRTKLRRENATVFQAVRLVFNIEVRRTVLCASLR